MIRRQAAAPGARCRRAGTGRVGAGGVVSAGPLLTHTAIAPFAIMGAVQAVIQHDHPRNSQQAEALRRFVTSLPEAEQFTRLGNLTTPENVLFLDKMFILIFYRAMSNLKHRSSALEISEGSNG